MSEEEILKLKIHDLVIIRADNENELDSLTKVVTIDHWRKRIGVVNFYDEYFEFPYRKVMRRAQSGTQAAEHIFTDEDNYALAIKTFESEEGRAANMNDGKDMNAVAMRECGIRAARNHKCISV